MRKKKCFNLWILLLTSGLKFDGWKHLENKTCSLLKKHIINLWKHMIHNIYRNIHYIVIYLKQVIFIPLVTCKICVWILPSKKYQVAIRNLIRILWEVLKKSIQRNIYVIVNVNNVLLTEISYLLSFCNLLKKVTLEILHQMSEIFSS